MSKHPEIDAVLAGDSDGCIITGDCLKIMADMPDDCVPMIWTDPPFGHGNMQNDLQAARVRDGVRGARTRAAQPIANDAAGEWPKVMQGFLRAAGRVLSPDCCCCCCCCCCMAGGGPNVTFARMSRWVDRAMAFFMAVVWDKSARGHGMGWRYRRNYEFVLVSHRRGGRLSWRDGAAPMPNIMYDVPPAKRSHPNEKPVSLIMKFINAHTATGDIILDPFCGSGTTCVAAKKLGRCWIGIEIDPGYAEIARRRVASTPKPLFTDEAATPRTLFQEAEA